MIDIENLSVQFGGKYLFDNVNLKINKGDKLALAGSNGSGKSTLLKLIAGKEQPETGKVSVPRSIKIGWLSQEFTELKGKTLFNEVKSSMKEVHRLAAEEKLILAELEQPDKHSDPELLKKLGEIHHRKDEINFYSADSEIERILLGLGFEIEDMHRLTDTFSGGWQMRIELAKILLGNNDVIMLDEPTNHLDFDSLQWLLSFLRGFRGTLIIVSHDKYFLNNVTTKTLEIFNRKLNFYNGTIDAFENFKKQRDEQLEAEYTAQQKKLSDIQKFVERFRYKATKARQVQSRIKMLEKIEIIDTPDYEKKIKIKFPDPPQSGQLPLDIISLTKSYGDKNVFRDVNLKLDRGDKIAFLGPNGAGKSTLARIVAGITPYESGEIIFGHNTIVSYYAQEAAEAMNPEDDLLETLAEASGGKTLLELRKLLGTFLFSDDDVFKKVGVLSGGEKSRVALARILLTKANLIILDEPTNHLDYNSKAVLQEALADFSGTLIIVSHDVDFLRPLVNKVLEIKNKKSVLYYGGIEYYMAKKEEYDAPEAVRTSSETAKSGKKDQKRLEAELRQKKYTLTKDILAGIKLLEAEIEKLEEEKELLERNLGSPDFYSDAQTARTSTLRYEQIKKILDTKIEDWSVLNEKIEEIEARLNREYNLTN